MRLIFKKKIKFWIRYSKTIALLILHSNMNPASFTIDVNSNRLAMFSGKMFKYLEALFRKLNTFLLSIVIGTIMFIAVSTDSSTPVFFQKLLMCTPRGVANYVKSCYFIQVLFN